MSLQTNAEYRLLVEDWEAFQESLRTPRPDAFRVNRRKTSPEKIRMYFEQNPGTVTQHPDLPDLFYWDEGDSPASKTVPYWAGHYYIQDPVTLLPVLALGLSEGETALDMCASPGGKSLHMSELVGPTGTVIANEPVPGRRYMLNGNVQRMGATNVEVTGYEGQSLPESRSFSAILVDPPCTGEGTVRRTSDDTIRAEEHERKKMVSTQWGLLKKAYRLLEPGGRLVYSTCTFAPEENEAVINRLLEETNAQLLDFDSPLPHDPGVTHWKSASYKQDVTSMWRCYPHHYDAGGMVFGKIRKPSVEEQL